jgi:hypothetical protein
MNSSTLPTSGGDGVQTSLSSNRWNKSKVAALALSAVRAIEAMKDEEDNNDNRRKDGRDFAGGGARVGGSGQEEGHKDA